jgi:hypothetical protein
MQHKYAAFNLMVNRLFTILMSAENKLKELKKIKLFRQNSQKTQLTTLAPLTKKEPPSHTILLLQKNYKTSSKNTKLCWFTPTKEKSYSGTQKTSPNN